MVIPEAMAESLSAMGSAVHHGTGRYFEKRGGADSSKKYRHAAPQVTRSEPITRQ